MALLSSVFLGYLQFQHEIRFLQPAYEWGNRFPHLEVHGTILYLQDNVVVEAAVQGHEVVVGRIGPVGFPVAPVLFAVVYEAAPYHQAAVWFERSGQHVCAFGVVSAVCEGARTEFRVGLDKKTAKVRYVFIYLSRFFAPPCLHSAVQRIGGVKASKFDGA